MIDIKAYDGNLWRVERIRKAIRIFGQIYGMTHYQMARIITKVEDNWGVLHIHWEEDCYPPTDEQESAFKKAWSLCGESPQNVEHHADLSI